MPRTRTRTIVKHLPNTVLGTLAIALSFSIGMRTAGNLTAIERSAATDNINAGDMNADGTVDEHDVILILEVAQGYRHATPQELAHDPNGDGLLTVDDAIRILRRLSK